MIPYIKTHRENKYNLASIQELRKRSNAQAAVQASLWLLQVIGNSGYLLPNDR